MSELGQKATADLYHVPNTYRWPLYFNNDSWIDTPFVDGAALVGDAAGWNDPIIGQGLSIAYRDVRIVSHALERISSRSEFDVFRELGYVP